MLLFVKLRLCLEPETIRYNSNVRVGRYSLRISENGELLLHTGDGARSAVYLTLVGGNLIIVR